VSTRVHFLFLNLGHFYDHLFMLVFATVAALSLSSEWGMSYGELIPYATPGFVAFGLCALPAGWLADRWSREGMMLVFFLGIGASGMATALATTPLQIACGLFAIGLFAAIYHPVGLALVIQGRSRTGVPIAINGVFGNMGVACAALLSGALIDHGGWRAAFVWPGAVAVATGVAYGVGLRVRRVAEAQAGVTKQRAEPVEPPPRNLLARLFAVVFFSTALGGLVFQSTTFALPKFLDERLAGLAASATEVGAWPFLLFSVASFGQLAVAWLVDRYAVRTVFALVAAIQAGLFVLMPGLQGWLAVAACLVFMLGVFGQIPINDVLLGRITRGEWRSRVYALRYLVTFSVMASSLPLIAWIHAGFGFDTLFRLLAGAAALIFAAAMLLPRGGRFAAAG
jgi:MFS family permease